MTSPTISAEQNGNLTRTAALLVFFLGVIIYIGNAGFPGLLDDADASHAMVSWEMLQRHDPMILYMNGIRYNNLEAGSYYSGGKAVYSNWSSAKATASVPRSFIR